MLKFIAETVSYQHRKRERQRAWKLFRRAASLRHKVRRFQLSAMSFRVPCLVFIDTLQRLKRHRLILRYFDVKRKKAIMQELRLNTYLARKEKFVLRPVFMALRDLAKSTRAQVTLCLLRRVFRRFCAAVRTQTQSDASGRKGAEVNNPFKTINDAIFVQDLPEYSDGQRDNLDERLESSSEEFKEDFTTR